jgi:prepilin-type N-terminal cleavage/methylation domain-containing protein
MKDAESGMTLTEVMVVVIIMALIATAVATAVLPAVFRSNEQITQADLRVVRGAAQRWILENPSAGCPTFEQLGLDPGARQVDAWDNPFEIDCDETGPVVWSRGPDGEAGTEDDIRVPAARRRGG